MARRPKSAETQLTAVHEAGHAIMAVHFGFPLGTVSIESDGFVAGFAKTPEAGEFMTQHPDAIFGLEKEIIVLMAGTEAMKAALPNLARPPWGDGGDREQIKVRVRDLCIFTEEREERAATRLRNVTGWYMTDFATRSAVIDFANELLRTPTIPKTRANKLIRGSLKRHHRDLRYGAHGIAYVAGRPVGWKTTFNG